MREFQTAGRPIIGSAPVGVEGTAAWLDAIAAVCNVEAYKLDAAKAKLLPAIKNALAAAPIKGRITLSGYEGSELIVGRLLVESGADLRYVGTACPRTPCSEADLEWLQAHGVEVAFRASLERDLAAMEEYAPDLAVGTTPVVQAAKSRAIPGALFHQPDLRAAADGRRRSGIVVQDRQRRARLARPLRRDARASSPASARDCAGLTARRLAAKRRGGEIGPC